MPILAVLCALAVFMWANNTSLFAERSGEMRLVAHRGLAQTFDASAVASDTNTAAMINEPEYPYLENTLESMRVAFEYGADCVELDVQLTKDGRLACFHDNTLEYRTDGSGSISDHTMSELKLLDIGYGYTADGGKTYPFRGTGVGQMPSLDEVFAAFPTEELLIHVRSSSVETGEVLWSQFSKLDQERLARIAVYGSQGPIDCLRTQCPTLRVMNKSIMINAVLAYEAIGWTGYIPQAIRNTELHLPMRYARLLWGWPAKFIERMESVNTRVVVVNGSGEWSEGFDSREDLAKLPAGYSGYVWTNRIDKVTADGIPE